MAKYINFIGGFNVGTKSAIDQRIILTKAEMLAVSNGSSYSVPDIYFALCSDDHRFYLYASKDVNHPWSVETGYYHPLEEFIDFNVTEKAKEQIEAAVDNSTTVSNLTTVIDGTVETPGLVKRVTEIEDKVKTIIVDGGTVE